MKKIKVIVILLLIATMVSFISPVIVNAENSKVYTSLSSVCTEIRKGILERRNEVNTTAVDYYFTVYYKTKSYNEKTIYDDIRKEVYKHTGKANEGDALNSSLSQDGLNISAKKQGEYYLLTITVYGDYYLTKDKVNQINKWVKDNALWLATKKYKTGNSDYGKALGIYKWITRNCKYGRTEIKGQWEPWNTAYGAKYKKGTCAGIAQLTYMMMTQSGLQCRMMRSMNHAWVVVKISGKWYIVDPTLGLGKTSTKYFLIGTKNYSYYKNVMKDEYGGYLTVSKTNYKK